MARSRPTASTAAATYRDAGVDIAAADAAKREIAQTLAFDDPRILNGIGPFATLIDGSFADYRDPVLVTKMEEPGSKQKLAMDRGAYASICYDLVHHLVNDILVMGAQPVAVQDAIVCGRIDRDVVTALVRAMGEACRGQECTLTGGETSEQPGVLDAGTYVITASILGVVEREHIIDGSRIGAGDTLMALASNGVHTNGISLIRRLLAADPELAKVRVGDATFVDAVLRPHLCYRAATKPLLGSAGLHGLAHITGGGVRDNLTRVLPNGVEAGIDLDQFRIPPVFGAIRAAGSVADEEMLRVYNLGVGMVAAVAPNAEGALAAAARAADVDAYPIGQVVSADPAAAGSVVAVGSLDW
jgi:phosphoribosylformylglycinamidine cyclo-ligase